jgi:acyl-CoA thioesterase-1
MRICFFGDSFVKGIGDDYGLGWASRIVAAAQHSGFTVTSANLGVPHATSEDISEHWQDEALCHLPRDGSGRLIFSFGTNDCLSGGQDRVCVPLTASMAYASRILSKAAFMAPLLMIGPAPILEDAATDERILQLSNVLSELCARLNIPFLEIFSFITTCEPWRREAAAGDGTHPNSGGYAALAGYTDQWYKLRNY